MIIDTSTTVHIDDNFSIIIEPYCHDCVKFLPTSDDEILYAKNRPYMITHTISCCNLDICRNIAKKMKEESQK